jgi:hypothetical protein
VKVKDKEHSLDDAVLQDLDKSWGGIITDLITDSSFKAKKV